MLKYSHNELCMKTLSTDERFFYKNNSSMECNVKYKCINIPKNKNPSMKA